MFPSAGWFLPAIFMYEAACSKPTQSVFRRMVVVVGGGGKGGRKHLMAPARTLQPPISRKKKLRGKKSFFSLRRMPPQPFLSALGSIKSSLWFIRMMNVRLGNLAVGGKTARKSLLVQFCRRPSSFPACFPLFSGTPSTSTLTSVT